MAAPVIQVRGLDEFIKELGELPPAADRDRAIRKLLHEGVKPLVTPARKRVDNKTKRYVINEKGKQTRAYKKLNQGRRTIGAVTGIAAGKYKQGFVSLNMRNTVASFKSRSKSQPMAMIGLKNKRKKGAWYASLQNRGGGKWNFDAKEVFDLSNSIVDATLKKSGDRVYNRMSKIVDKVIK